MAEPRVSIVLPTKDGGALLRDVLDAVASQKAAFAFETIAIDSGSTDGTVELLGGRVDKLIRIAPEEFNHGLTRNRGIDAARGDLIVLLVQDAVPFDEHWLDRLTAPLVADARLAGTWARQVPREGASRLTRRMLAGWIGSRDEPRRSRITSREAFDAMPPVERLLLCTFDDVCSCLRRSVWESHPFRATPIAEDLEWAREVLLAGHELAFVPEAVVVHSHERGFGYELDRTRQLHGRLAELFGVRTIPTIGALLRSWGATIADHVDCLRHGDGPTPDVGEWIRALSLAIAWPLGQYQGGKRG